MTLDFEKWLGLIETFIQAPTWKAVVIIIGILGVCFLIIAKYFFDENKRRKEAFLEAQKIKKEQAETAERLQRDASIALIENMDSAFEQDFQDFKRYIDEKKFSSILMNIPRQYHQEIGTFLYNEDLNSQDRAARIINIFKDIRDGIQEFN